MEIDRGAIKHEQSACLELISVSEGPFWAAFLQHENKMAAPLNVLRFQHLYPRYYGDFSLQKDFPTVWSKNDGKAKWTLGGCQRPQQGTNPASAKITSCSYSSYSSYSCKMVYSTTAQKW